jgi:hypothetical protein
MVTVVIAISLKLTWPRAPGDFPERCFWIQFQAADLWHLEHYLTERRKEIDRKYEFRSSRLTRVFGRLLYERRVSEEELRGLREDKMKAIRSCAEVLSEDAA